MDLSKFYICICLVVAIDAIAIPQYAYREVHDKAEALQKKAPIPILKQSFEQSKEGYQFSYDTGNGIHAEESGYIKNKGDEKHEVVVQKGTITYHDEHGKPISLSYIADEKGFRPTGEHLPTPPPIPAEILKSLEQNAREEHQEQHLEQVHHTQIVQSAQKEAPDAYQYQQPEQVVEYEAPQKTISQKEYQKLIQEQIQKQLREQQHSQTQQEYQQPQQEYQQPQQEYQQPQQEYQQPQQEYHQPQQEYQIRQYHQAGY